MYHHFLISLFSKLIRYSNYNFSSKSTRSPSRAKIVATSSRKAPPKHRYLTKKMISQAARSYHKDPSLVKPEEPIKKIKSEHPKKSVTENVDGSAQQWFYPHNPKQGPKKPPLYPEAKAHTNDSSKKGLYYLKKYQEQILGVAPDMVGTNHTGKCNPPPLGHLDDSILSTPNDPVSNFTHTAGTPLDAQSWKLSLPTQVELYRQEFGQPCQDESFTQEACAETCLHFVLKSGF